MAYYFFGIAERASWLIDVFVLGTPGHLRYRYFFRPCSCCGHSNKCATDVMIKEERHVLKDINP